MKKLIVAAALSLGALAPVLAQPNVGISIGINQPGVYGRIDLGGGPPPPPALVYERPVIIAQPDRVLPRQPIYLYVPPMHQQNWARYCGRYSACGQPVYFVQDQWVRERYAQAHRGGPRFDRDDRGPRDGRGPHGRDGWDGRDGRDHRDGRDGRWDNGRRDGR